MLFSSHRLGDAPDSSVGLVSIQPRPGKLWREAEGLQRFSEPERGELDKPDPLSLMIADQAADSTSHLSVRHILHD